MRRRLRLWNVISAAIAISVALLLMSALFAPDGWLEALAALTLQLVVVTAAIAVLVGVANLLAVHLGRLRRRERGAFYSLFVILTAAAVVAIRIINLKTSDTDAPVNDVIFEAVQVSLESALAGLLFFVLVYAAYRMMHRRVTWSGVLFTAALLLVLVGWLPLKGLDVVSDLRNWLLEIPVTAGARGILIGIALGTVTVGLRVLTGQERAYREE